MPDGKLIVLEGPDGAGKSTISELLKAGLSARGHSPVTARFPGKSEGTLGLLVYNLHHDPAEWEVESIDKAALQIMHVAAHVDQIHGQLLGLIRGGSTVILDRFWWSTWAYGVEQGVSVGLLDSLIEVERFAWGDQEPTLVVLLDGRHRDEISSERSQQLASHYQSILEREKDRYPCICLLNDDDAASAVTQIIREIT